MINLWSLTRAAIDGIIPSESQKEEMSSAEAGLLTVYTVMQNAPRHERAE
jgi:hypothetical protein